MATEIVTKTYLNLKRGKVMKRISWIIPILLASIMSMGCDMAVVDGGEEVVFVYQPVFPWSTEGVDMEPLTEGLAYTVWTTREAKYNVKPITYKESFIDLTSSDNVPIDFDSYLTLKIINGKSPLLHKDSGKEWYMNKVQDQYRMLTRNEARTRKADDLRRDEVTIVEAQNSVFDQLTKYIEKIELPVTVVRNNISKVIPPKEVLDESAKTAAQKQRVLTQTQREQAEISRLKAEQAAAIADKGYSDKFSMTTEQFLRNKELEIMSKAVETGNVSLIMNASDAQPIFKTRM